MSLSYLDIKHLYHLPCHVYWKDREGVYLGSNDYHAEVAGVPFKGSDIIGLKDFDFYTEDSATVFRTNDQTVLEAAKAITCVEDVKYIQGIEYKVLTYKQPLFNKQDNPSSVLGLSFILSQENVLENFTQLIPKLHLEQKGNNSDHLTPRQKDCLYHLVLGQSAKQIAKALNLSVRTVEHHLEVIKRKYHCTSRSRLICKALSLPFIKEKLLAF